MKLLFIFTILFAASAMGQDAGVQLEPFTPTPNGSIPKYSSFPQMDSLIATLDRIHLKLRECNKTAHEINQKLRRAIENSRQIRAEAESLNHSFDVEMKRIIERAAKLGYSGVDK